MTLIELRETLEILLGDLIGTYKLPQGSEIPAVYVDGSSGVPKDWQVSGLEVSIKQYPARASRRLMSMVEMTVSWEVRLSQYNPETSSLDTAIDRLLRHFPDATLTGFPATDRGYQYARLIITDVELAFQYRRAGTI